MYRYDGHPDCFDSSDEANCLKWRQNNSRFVLLKCSLISPCKDGQGPLEKISVNLDSISTICDGIYLPVEIEWENKLCYAYESTMHYIAPDVFVYKPSGRKRVVKISLTEILKMEGARPLVKGYFKPSS